MENHKKEEIDTEKSKNSEESEKQEQTEKLISTHIFILPFKILNPDNIDRIELLLKEKEKWEDCKINPDVEKYLNKYAKEALFSNYGDSGNDDKVIEKIYKDIQKGIYKIYFEHNDKEAEKSFKKEYLLEIEDIKLKCFDTNIGTLSFILNNRKYKEIEDILYINNLGRKLYRAYTREECPKISLYDTNRREIVSQDIYSADIVKKTEKLKNNIISYFLKTEDIEIILDDRMFVMSHYISEPKKEKGIEDFFFEEKQIDEWRKSKNWYKYIFIDTGDPTCQDEKMMKELLENSTYVRWKDYKTLYGISRYSFSAWSSSDFINNHMKNHYFQLVSLVVAQKATIISLNEKMNNLINRIINGKDDETYESNEETKEYLTYLSKMHFSEITQQEQGIELYDFFQKKMRIKELLEELDLKIKTLNEKLERDSDKRDEEREKENQSKIERFGILFAIVGLFAGGIFEISFEGKSILEIATMVILIVCVVIFSKPLINYSEFPKYLKEVLNSWISLFKRGKKNDRKE